MSRAEDHPASAADGAPATADRQGPPADGPTYGRLRAFLPKALFFLLPLAFIIPNFVRIGPFRLNWYELLLPLVFLLGWHKGGNRLSIALVGLATTTALAVLFASDLFGVEATVNSFALLRYLVSFIAALQLGLRLPFRNLDRPNPLALLSFFALFGIVAASAVVPDIRSMVAGLYGFEEHDHSRFQLIDPNPLVLGSVAIILYFLASRGRTFGVRVMLLIPTFLTVVLAQQRTSTILLLLLVFLSEYVLRRRNLIFPMIASIGLSVLLVAAVVEYGGDSAYADRVSTFSLERQSRSAVGRLIQYRLQIQQVGDFPILGVGRFPEEVGLPLAAWYPAPRVEPHSQYVGVVYEAGVIGALMFGLLMLQVLRIGVGLYRRRRRSQVTRSVLAFGILNLVAMIPWESLYLPHWTVVFFLLCGAALAEERVVDARASLRSTPRSTPRPATAGA